MIRAIWFLAKLGVLLAAILWVAERPGTAQIRWLGYTVDMPIGVFLAATALLILTIAQLDRFWRSFVSVPAVYRRYKKAQAREKGLTALTRGLAAVAAGNGRDAGRQARRAQALLPDQPLTTLLVAQAALLSGNDNAAAAGFGALLQDRDAAFLGLRGLLNDAARKGDEARALELIRLAESLQPKSGWVVENVFRAEAEAAHWEKALQSLGKAVRLGAIGREEGDRLRVALWLAQALEAEAKSLLPVAVDFARKAFRLDPGFAPAAAIYARLLRDTHREKQAAKVIEECWRRAPHPDLARLWESLMPEQRRTRAVFFFGKGGQKLSEDIARVQWAQRLHDAYPGHAQSARIVGRAALDARLWGEARAHLLRAQDFRALALLERRESGNEAQARQWLEQAADEPPAGLWSCAVCATPAPQGWTPTCAACGKFATLEWREAGDTQNFSALTPPRHRETGFIEPPPAA